jgi:hypothetical protein
MCDHLADPATTWPPTVLFSGEPTTSRTHDGDTYTYRIEYDDTGVTLHATINGDPVDTDGTDGPQLFYTHWLNSGGPWR